MHSVMLASTVARATVKLWTREVASLFRVSQRKLTLITIGGTVLACVFGLVLGFATASQLSSAIPLELRKNILFTAFGNAVLTTTLVSAILCVTMPARTALQTLLEMLPISRRLAMAGQLAPLLCLGFVLSGALSTVALVLVAKMYGDPVRVSVAAVALAVLVLVVQLTAVSLFTIVSGLLRRFLGLPQQYSATLAAGAVIALGILSMIGDVFALGPIREEAVSWRMMLPNRIAANTVANPDVAAIIGVSVWAIIAAVLTLASAALHGQGDGPSTIRLFTRTRPFHGPFGASVWADVLVAVRSPQAVTTVLALIDAIAVVQCMVANPLLHDIARPLATSVPVMPFYLSVYAVGRTLRTHWVGIHLLARRSWWIFPKFVGYLALSSAISIPAIGAELALQLVAVGDLPAILSRALLAFSAALLAGTLVPYTDEQPLSIAIAGFSAAIIYIGTTTTLSLVAQSNEVMAMSAVTVIVAIALLGTYRMVAANHTADDVRRA